MRLTANLQTAIRSHIEIWKRHESHGVIRRVVRPHRLYRYTCLLESKRVRYQFIGWRVFLKTKNRKTTALDILPSSDGYRFYGGDVASYWLRRAQAVERRKIVTLSQYEPRILTIPPIHATFLWFASREAGKSDLFEYLDRETAGRGRWMTRREIDELVRTTVSASSRLWSDVTNRPADES